MFHNSNLFGSCIIHISYTECAKIKKNYSGTKRLKWINPFWNKWFFLEIKKIERVSTEQTTCSLSTLSIRHFFFFLSVYHRFACRFYLMQHPLYVTCQQYVPNSDAKQVSPSYLIFGRCRQDDIDSEMRALRARRISIYIRRSRLCPHENKRLYFHFKWHNLASLTSRGGSTTLHITKKTKPC